MADFNRAEGVSCGAGVTTTSSSCISSLSHHHLLLSSANSIPSRSMSLLLPSVSQSQSQHTLSGSHQGSVMSGRPPRLQSSSAGGSRSGTGSAAVNNKTEVISAPVPTLDPVHRQKIMQLRLQAAKASMKRQSSLRRKLLSFFFGLFFGFLAVVGYFRSVRETRRRKYTSTCLLALKDISVVGRHFQLDCINYRLPIGCRSGLGIDLEDV